MSEFALIAAIRRRVADTREDVVLGIGDDAALLDVPAGSRLVACTDTLVEGVHFLRGTAPADLGWKSLAVNLSDLAAMGAKPAWALLALTLPDGNAAFVDGFADGFAALAGAHGVALVGGDTTQGPLTITVTALGFVPVDRALQRAGAHAGDAVFVTGTPGDAAAALRLLQDGRVPGPVLLARLRRPTPRVAAGLALRGVATACIDVSDGLVADLGHVCAASGVGAEIELAALPLSRTLSVAFDANACHRFALAGGDDYELCFTAPAARADAVMHAGATLDLPVTCIGRVVAGQGVRVLDAHGNTFAVPHAGWEHFST